MKLFSKIIKNIVKKTTLTTTIVIILTSVVLAATTPDRFVYEGRLLDNMGDVIANPHTFRFSLWSTEDFTAANLTATGAINTTSPEYSGWQEEQVLTPNPTGSFSFRLGDNTALPDIDFTKHKYLQVEVKPQGALDIAYELMDPTGDNGADLIDRQLIGSAPYAKNAEKLENHKIGLIQGDVALVGPNDQFLPQLIPGKIMPSSFTLDFDNDVENAGTGDIELIFGDTLGKILSYSVDNNWFNFNDDVNIQGDLTVTGTINGVILGITNRTISLETEYSGSTVDGDGTNNRGKLAVYYDDTDGIPGNNNYNYYKWTTRNAGTQDIDIIIRTRLPDGFDHWQAIPIEFTYKTADGNVANNKVDMTIEDSAGNSVVLTGATDLANANWTTTNITFGGGETWTAGELITIKVKLSTINTGSAIASGIKLNYVGS